MNTSFQERVALGTTIRLSVVSTLSSADVRELFRELWRTIFVFERRCSRFLPNSELCQFNDAAGVKRPISPELRDILIQARAIGVQTGGLYNPFVLPLLQRAGYVQSFLEAYENDAVMHYEERTLAPVTELQVGDDWARIPYGTAIDLGGCGKGYIGDVLADLLDDSPNVISYWLSLGGDVIAKGKHENGEPLAVNIARSGAADRMIASVPIGSQRYAVATSTITKRRGVHSGVPWHHIIDPRTSLPAVTDVETATVGSASLLAADVHASNLVIIGMAGARTYAKQQQITDVLLQGGPTTAAATKKFGTRIKMLDGQGTHKPLS